jgi:hypothetical protein
VLSVATLLAGFVISFVAFFFFGFRGDTDDGSHAPQAVFLAMALGGTAVTLGMLVQSINGTGHPGRWLAAAVTLLSPYPILWLVASIA